MSCDGWDVGQKFQTMVAMTVQVLQQGTAGSIGGGSAQAAQIIEGAIGIVLSIEPKSHTMEVKFKEPNISAMLTHDQIHGIRKM